MSPDRHTLRIATSIALLLLLSTSAACVSNHSFSHGAALDVPDLVSGLEAQRDDEDALFDLTYLPLLHLDLQAFTETDEHPSYPEGHEFLSIRSWLPLFLVVDGEVEYFDTDHAAYERNEFTAVLWGLWARSKTTLRTLHGDRVARNSRVLWFLDWEDTVEYSQALAPSTTN